ncbi:MAG: cell division protein ZapA [Flavobacteriales bacterium]|jgi:cell division protein ZapA|tara:strand:- start:5057 stop:5344 length:288 start_codon:yes stop_codon:yes gene_type:complete
MEKLKIKLSIANRIYPLTIDPSQEEGLRKAALDINNMIKQLEQSYSVNDKQDVLAMCALQFASKTKQRSIDNVNSNKSFEIKLKELNELISETIS